ncbi:MAG TPA: glycerophosphodiester phosphodiesterase, partial [Thermodesulfobacteriota bacterium]|nr:glycerophosphodiester phosphodiesterase [Thermodesulfobacteriota bacterium]
GQALVNIEIKHPDHGLYPITELTDHALNEVKNAGMIDRVIFSSFIPAALEGIQKNDPRVWLALLYHRSWKDPSEVTGGKEYSVLNLRHSYLTRSKIAGLHQAGMKVNVYTVNSGKELEQFVRWGVDGIITNYPDRLNGILRKKRG